MIEHSLEDLLLKNKLLEEEKRKLSEHLRLFENGDFIVQRFANTDPYILYAFLRLLHNGLLEKNKTI
jgi:hypothetical protein